jgi:hypothetical protein
MDRQKAKPICLTGDTEIGYTVTQMYKVVETGMVHTAQDKKIKYKFSEIDILLWLLVLLIIQIQIATSFNIIIYNIKIHVLYIIMYVMLTYLS